MYKYENIQIYKYTLLYKYKCIKRDIPIYTYVTKMGGTRNNGVNLAMMDVTRL
jgi:hypothetical protein